MSTLLYGDVLALVVEQLSLYELLRPSGCCRCARSWRAAAARAASARLRGEPMLQSIVRLMQAPLCATECDVEGAADANGVVFESDVTRLQLWLDDGLSTRGALLCTVEAIISRGKGEARLVLRGLYNRQHGDDLGALELHLRLLLRSPSGSAARFALLTDPRLSFFADHVTSASQLIFGALGDARVEDRTEGRRQAGGPDEPDGGDELGESEQDGGALLAALSGGGSSVYVPFTPSNRAGAQLGEPQPRWRWRNIRRTGAHMAMRARLRLKRRFEFACARALVMAGRALVANGAPFEPGWADDVAEAADAVWEPGVNCAGTLATLALAHAHLALANLEHGGAARAHDGDTGSPELCAWLADRLRARSVDMVAAANAISECAELAAAVNARSARSKRRASSDGRAVRMQTHVLFEAPEDLKRLAQWVRLVQNGTPPPPATH